MEMYVDEPIDNDDPELYELMTRIRQQSEELFKNIITTQVNFNESINEDLSINLDEKKDYLKRHMNLIEETCKNDKDVESLFTSEKKLLDDKVGNNINIKNTDHFNK